MAAKSTPLPTNVRPPIVVHEGVAGDHRPPAGPHRPQAIVVVLEAADAEPFVEQPDRVDHLAADQQAEADSRSVSSTAAVMGLAPVPGEAVEPGQVVVTDATCCCR